MNIDHMTIGFVGLGLIGGSIAKTIRRVFPETIIHGFDIDAESGRQAEKEGVLTHFYEEADKQFADCDIIFLCAPVEVNIEYLTKLRPFLSSHCLITDVGSVKEPMQQAVKKLQMESRFIGGHPMVGSEKSGFINSNDHLLENAYYFLTPTYHTQFQLVTMFSTYIQRLGALAVNLRPEEHDFITASISHIPHIVAAELVHLVRRSDHDNGMLKQLAAGGFKDITRIASSSPKMWESICFTNEKNIKELLTTMCEDLQEVIHQIDIGNKDYITEYFRQAGEYRNSVPEHAIGLFDQVYSIYVDIPDEPGTIASIASQLAYHNINIKNIGIVHNREFEEGVLEVILYDGDSCEEAAKCLQDRNYVVHIR